MSVSRLALRLAVVEALMPHTALVSGLYPTIAGRRVYDSRMDALDDAEIERAEPIAVVYTETQRDETKPGAKTPASIPIITLVIEILVASAGQMVVTTPDGTEETIDTLAIVQADRQQEALLDLLEAQVRRALDPHSTEQSSALFRRTVVEVRDIESTPLRDAERTVRLAQRTLTFTLRVRETTWPAPDSIATGLEGLPEPLRTVALALPAGSSARLMCEAMAPLVAAPTPLTPLETIAIYAAVDGTDAPTADTANFRASALTPPED